MLSNSRGRGKLTFFSCFQLYPLWVAQDPMFFWNIIAHFGSVRAAVESCAPQKKWDSIFGPRGTTPMKLPPIAADAFPPNVRKCFISKCTAPECVSISAEGTVALCCFSTLIVFHCSRNVFVFKMQDKKVL
jgi:hypothetical protein